MKVKNWDFSLTFIFSYYRLAGGGEYLFQTKDDVSIVLKQNVFELFCYLYQFIIAKKVWTFKIIPYEKRAKKFSSMWIT